MDKQINGWMNKLMDGWMDRQLNGHTLLNLAKLMRFPSRYVGAPSDTQIKSFIVNAKYGNRGGWALRHKYTIQLCNLQ